MNRAAAASGRTVEWLVGLASAAIVAAMLAYLGYQAVVDTGGTPAIELSIGEPRAVGGSDHVDVTVRNTDASTAAGVTIRATDSAGRASKSIEFDYVPAGSSRQGTFVLERGDAARAAFTVDGYSDP